MRFAPRLRDLLAVAAFLLPTAGAMAQPVYDFLLVDSLNANPLAGETRLAFVNDHGIACGVTTVDNVIGYPGIVWEQASGRTRIPVSNPSCVSNSGLVVGIGSVYDLTTGQTFSPPNLPGTYYAPSFAAVNDAGTAVGSISITSGSDSGGILRIPYIWDAVNGARTLAVPNAKSLYRINNAGAALGWMNDLLAQGPFLVDIESGVYTEIAALLPPDFGVGYPSASDINDRGDIVGSRPGIYPVYRYGYVYSPVTGFHILPFPGTGYQQTVTPTAINNSGAIVGTLSTDLASQHVFFYTVPGGLIDLNTSTLIAGMPPGYRLHIATEVNNLGWIVGYGYTAAGKITGFILRPRTLCPADFNHSGSLSVQDIFDYLAAWFAGTPSADLNGNGLSVQDIFDFLNAWFTGC